MVLRSFVPVISIFPLSIVVSALFGPYLAIGCWILVAPASILMRYWPLREDRIAHRRAPEAVR